MSDDDLLDAIRYALYEAYASGNDSIRLADEQIEALRDNPNVFITDADDIDLDAVEIARIDRDVCHPDIYEDLKDD